MKAFVTGGTGFVGGYLVPRLLARDHEVTCLVRDRERGVGLADLGAALVLGDLVKAPVSSHALAGHDWLIHLANLYSFWEPDPEEYRRVNVEGTARLFEAALQAGISKVLHVSSVVVWGCPEERPFTEEDRPGEKLFSAYARSKAEGDQVAWRMHTDKGLPLVMLYPGAIMGPGDPKPTGRVVKDVIDRKMPAIVCPDSVMTFVDVRDVAEAIVLAAENPDTIGQAYLLGIHHLRMEEAINMVCEMGEVTPPRFTMPDRVTGVLAKALTAVAKVTKRPPKWGLSDDQFNQIRAGFVFEGTKAVTELGLNYTPLRQTLDDTVAACLQTNE